MIEKRKAPTPKVDAPKGSMSLRTPPILWSRQDRHFYFRLFLLSRKASNAITKLPKAISKANMPMKIERISKAVICATSPPTYYVRFVFPVNRSLSVGRLPPCHGYFPMAFATLIIYHYSRHSSTNFYNSFSSFRLVIPCCLFRCRLSFCSRRSRLTLL